MEIKLPHLGDGIDSAVVLSVLVSPGDMVTKDQTILELETDKAVAPIPCPTAGKVTAIHVKSGDTVSMGTLVLSIEGDAASSTATAPVVSTPAAVAPVSVSSGPTPTPSTGPLGSYTFESASGAEPPASPSIRKMAQLFGLDLRRVRGTGNGGRITTPDVQAHLSHLQFVAFQVPATAPVTAAPTKAAPPALPDFSKFGSIEIQPVTSLRKKIGQKMSDAWTTVPHVTQFDDADITQLMALRKKYVPEYEKKGIKLSVTVLLLKAVVDALKKFPIFNSTYDEANGQMIMKNYFNFGIAVDTDNGLIVPVIRNVDQKSLETLSADLSTIAEKARTRQVSLEDLQGSSFTISNLGSLGVGPFTPIVNTPEVAILGLSKGVTKPVVIDGKIEIRTLLPLSLSYDHRIIDGADGARFSREIIAGIEQFNEEYLKGN
jgi:pyruvate dehydrogenase E2 component (dihydrolipoamide acetyltransferase)